MATNGKKVVRIAHISYPLFDPALLFAIKQRHHAIVLSFSPHFTPLIHRTPSSWPLPIVGVLKDIRAEDLCSSPGETVLRSAVLRH